MQLDFSTKPIARAAYELAKHHHDGIYRKYCGEPYINHPVRVTETIVRHGIVDQDVMAAALLHDCVEDENIRGERMRPEIIQRHCGTKVARWVEALTAPPHSAGNRARRKEIYNESLMRAPWQVRMIKAADILDNITGISVLDPEFANTYLTEKDKQLTCIQPPASEYQWGRLFDEAWKQLREEQHEYALALLKLHRQREKEILAETVEFDALVNEMVQERMPNYAMF